MADDSRAKHALAQQQQLESDRSVLDSHLREIAERVLPRQDNFQQSRQVEGDKRTEKIFDSTACLALDRAASAVDSLVCPQTQTYHRMEPEDERLLQDRDTKLWCEELNKAHFRMRYRPAANFASQSHECFVSLMAFGSLGMFTDDYIGIGTRYKSISLAELWFAENYAGILDLAHRRYPMSARAAVQKFREKTPKKIQEVAEKEPFKKFEFLHCVKPNEERKTGKRDYAGMAFSSYYISYEGEQMIDVGGYRVMPYAMSRHVTAPRETYGRSPAMMVLPDIKMLNEMEKTGLRAMHKAVSPPLLAYGDGILSAFSTRPDAINYGGVNEQGQQLVVPMRMGGNIPMLFEAQEAKRKVVNDAFYVTLFQILVNNPQMTATEALIRAQEKGQLLAPTIGRQQSEFLGMGVIPREQDILYSSGFLLHYPMPDALRRAGGRLKAVYTSPLTRLRRAEDGVAIQRWVDSVLPLAEADPSIMDNIDTDEYARQTHEIHGVPVLLLRAPDVVAQMRDSRNKKAEEMRQAEVAKESAGATALAAKAHSTMQETTQSQPA